MGLLVTWRGAGSTTGAAIGAVASNVAPASEACFREEVGGEGKGSGEGLQRRKLEEVAQRRELE